MHQNVFFPMPLWMHLIFTAVSVVMLILSFIYKKKIYKLVLAADVAGTLLVYAVPDRTMLSVLGVAEILLYIAYRVLKYYETKPPVYIGEHYARQPKQSIWDIINKL